MRVLFAWMLSKTSILRCAHYSKRSKKCCTLLRVQRRTVVGQTFKNYVVGNVVSDKLRLACALLRYIFHPSAFSRSLRRRHAVRRGIPSSFAWPMSVPMLPTQHKKTLNESTRRYPRGQKVQASGKLLRRDDHNTSTRRHCCVASSFQRPPHQLLLPIDSYLIYSFKNAKDE